MFLNWKLNKHVEIELFSDRADAGRQKLPWTPSWLQYLILPVRISSRKGWKTTYLKWTGGWKKKKGGGGDENKSESREAVRQISLLRGQSAAQTTCFCRSCPNLRPTACLSYVWNWHGASKRASGRYANSAHRVTWHQPPICPNALTCQSKNQTREYNRVPTHVHWHNFTSHIEYGILLLKRHENLCQGPYGKIIA